MHEVESPRENHAPGTSVHVYGRNSAVCFEKDRNRKGIATLSVDGAAALGDKQYDWANKIRVQLTVNELAEIAAVLLGMAPHCEARYHGTNRNKHLRLENQGGHFFIRLQEAERAIAVQVPPGDGLRSAVLATQQMQSALGNAEASLVLTALRNLGRMMSAGRGEENGPR